LFAVIGRGLPLAIENEANRVVWKIERNMESSGHRVQHIHLEDEGRKYDPARHGTPSKIWSLHPPFLIENEGGEAYRMSGYRSMN
jgi:hypothetical protein